MATSVNTRSTRASATRVRTAERVKYSTITAGSGLTEYYFRTAYFQFSTNRSSVSQLLWGGPVPNREPLGITGGWLVGWLVGWSLTALATQFSSYRAFKY